MKNRLIIILILVLAGCSKTGITDDQIRTDFEQEFPTYNFISYSVLHNDGDSLRVEVKFSKPTFKVPFVDFWTYKLRSQKWELMDTGEKRAADSLKSN